MRELGSKNLRALRTSSVLMADDQQVPADIAFFLGSTNTGRYKSIKYVTDA